MAPAAKLALVTRHPPQQPFAMHSEAPINWLVTCAWFTKFLEFNHLISIS
jgi:hypothetical protein